MSKQRTDLLEGQRLPQDFIDSIQEFLGSQASPNLVVSLPNSTTLRIAAGADNAQVAIAINGHWRWITANADAAAPGGLVVGDNPIFVVASPNVFGTNPAPPPTELDSTDYTFRLMVLPAGSTPSGTGTQTHYRQIGVATWNGTAFTDVRQTVGGAALPKHAATHLAGASDSLAWTTAHGFGTAAARPTAAATNTGYVYYATDTGVFSRSNGSTWDRQDVYPYLHAAAHLPTAGDALPWATIHGYGTLAARPTAASTNAGFIYYATDTTTLARSNGATWDSLTAAPPSNTSIASAILLSGTLALRPAAAAGNAGFYYFATDVNGGTLYQSSGAAWSVLLQSAVTTDAPKKLYQGTLAAAAATVYTVPAAKQTRYETCRLFNNDTVARTVTLYDGGTAAGNTILPATEIPANDWIELDMSGMGGQAGATIAAVASAAGVVVMTLYGSEEDVGQRLYKKLYQGTPGNAFATVLTTGARERISHIRAANTNGASTLGIGLSDGGNVGANIIQNSSSPSSQITPGGVMEIQSYIAMASGVTLGAAAQGSGTDIVLTVYGIEG